MDTDTLIAQGKSALARGDFEHARRLFRRASAQAPFRPDIKNLLAMALDERAPDNRMSDVVIEPQRPFRGSRKAVLIGIKPKKKRRSSLTPIIKPVILLIGLFMIGGGIFSFFHMRSLTAVPASKPAQSPEILDMMARARQLSTSGRYEEAVLLLGKARERSSDAAAVDKAEAEVHYLHANTMSVHKEYQEAIRILERALALAPKEARYLTEKGWNLHLAARNASISDPDEGERLEKAACDALEMALTVEPDNVLALHTLGRAYSALGQKEIAAKYYRHLIEVQPDSLQAQAARRELDQWGISDR